MITHGAAFQRRGHRRITGGKQNSLKTAIDRTGTGEETYSPASVSERVAVPRVKTSTQRAPARSRSRYCTRARRASPMSLGPLQAQGWYNTVRLIKVADGVRLWLSCRAYTVSRPEKRVPRGPYFRFVSV